MDVRGLWVPLLTPMARGGALDLDVLGPHVDRLLAAGVDGFVALGTTGEFADLDDAERPEVIRAAVAAVAGRAPVLAGVGGVGTTAARAQARAAEEAGADGVLVLPPLYWKLDTERLIAHYAAVSDACGLPLMLYDFPALAGTGLTAEVISRVAREVPRIIGIKLSGPDLRLLHAVVAAVEPADFAVMVGQDALLVPAVLAGARGGILAVANVLPEVARGALDALAQDDLAMLRRHHERLLMLGRLGQLANPPLLALKAAAAAAGSPMQAWTRTPVPDGEEVARRATALVRELLQPNREVAAAGQP
ncbi:MAG: dihydrodipicolinate synthase family protein [Egibacteraceae bacterium]